MKIFGNIFEKFKPNARNQPQNRRSNRIYWKWQQKFKQKINQKHKKKKFCKNKTTQKKYGPPCNIIFGGEGEIRSVATTSKFAIGGSVSLGRGFGGICAMHNFVV